MQTISERLGNWSGRLDLGSVPAAVLDQARRCVVDVVGVSLAGSSYGLSPLIRKHTQLNYAKGPCTVLGRDYMGASAPGSAFANGVFAHVLDFDDTCYEGIVHGSAAIFPAVAAACELVQASGETFLASFVAGVEAEYALGRAFTNQLYWKGWWNTGVLGAIGAAAGAARALRLDPDAVSQAISIAACQAAGPRVLLGSQVKPFAMGRTAETGITAALMARSGMTGPADVFEHERGLARLFNDGLMEPGALDALGNTFALLKPGIAFKLYPACSAAQAAMEALQSILAEEHIPPGAVSHVHCEVTPLVAICLIHDRPRTLTEAQFSMPFGIGCVLTHGDMGVAQLSEDVLFDPRVRAAMEKVTMAPSDALARTEDDRRDHPEGAVVTVTTDDGRSFRRVNPAATGMPVKPMSDERLSEKFRSCARTVLPEREAEVLLSRLWEVEAVHSFSSIFGRQGS